jgi:hypothetical protein
MATQPPEYSEIVIKGNKIVSDYRSGIDWNDRGNGAPKSHIVAGSCGLQRKVRGLTHKPDRYINGNGQTKICPILLV